MADGRNRKFNERERERDLKRNYERPKKYSSCFLSSSRGRLYVANRKLDSPIQRYFGILLHLHRFLIFASRDWGHSILYSQLIEDGKEKKRSEVRLT